MTVVLSQNIPSKEKVCKEVLRHFVKKGTARLGDYSLVENAINLCMKHGIGDITIFDSPQDVINKYGNNMETKQLNPDDFKTLTNRTEYPLRLVTYDVEPTEQGFKDIANILKNQLGERSSLVMYDFLEFDDDCNIVESSLHYYRCLLDKGSHLKVVFRDGLIEGIGVVETNGRCQFEGLYGHHFHNAIPFTTFYNNEGKKSLTFYYFDPNRNLLLINPKLGGGIDGFALPCFEFNEFGSKGEKKLSYKHNSASNEITIFDNILHKNYSLTSNFSEKNNNSLKKSFSVK